MPLQIFYAGKSLKGFRLSQNQSDNRKHLAIGPHGLATGLALCKLKLLYPPMYKCATPMQPNTRAAAGYQIF